MPKKRGDQLNKPPKAYIAEEDDDVIDRVAWTRGRRGVSLSCYNKVDRVGSRAPLWRPAKYIAATRVCTA